MRTMAAALQSIPPDDVDSVYIIILYDSKKYNLSIDALVLC